jgi:peptide/nickel transport system ATP-binding protein
MAEHDVAVGTATAEAARSPARPPLLELRDLRTHFHTREGTVRAVDGVSFSLRAGEILGIVGESGCGKSMTSLSIMRLVPCPPGEFVSGEILLEGRDLLKVSEEKMRHVRGKDISMIFQEPMTSLNPVLTIGEQIAETVIQHEGLSQRAALDRAAEMLGVVGIAEPRRRLSEYPHQLSGGMRQRVMIAIALSCNPKVLIADEPTTALDVTIQAQILELLADLRQRLGTAIILITHDLGVIAEAAERVVVMYAGRIVEEAGVEDLFEHPQHPYTRGLMGSVPHLSVRPTTARVRLAEIPGMVPSLDDLPPGCTFEPRCRFATARCSEAYPPLETKRLWHRAACFESARLPIWESPEAKL